MTTAPVTNTTGQPDRYIETSYANGTWHRRRNDSAIPFASGPDELEQIALGVQVARWNRLPHIVRTRTGAISEILHTA